jgi:hypothetical protein
VTTLPALEAALDEAAHRYYGKQPRRSRWRLVVIPAATVAASAAVLLALPSRTQGPAQAPPPEPPVPPATLALSRALTQAPPLPDFRVDAPLVAHADLAAVADAYENETPYPPGRRDTFDWASTAVGPYDMSSINYARDVRSLVQWRAACIWLNYWLQSAAESRIAAAVVLGDVPSWPSLRAHPGNWADVPAQVGLQDTAALQLQYRNDCSPWRDRQER